MKDSVITYKFTRRVVHIIQLPSGRISQQTTIKAQNLIVLD